MDLTKSRWFAFEMEPPTSALACHGCKTRTANFTVPELRVLEVGPLVEQKLLRKAGDLFLRHSVMWQSWIQGDFGASLVSAEKVIVCSRGVAGL